MLQAGMSANATRLPAGACAPQMHHPHTVCMCMHIGALTLLRARVVMQSDTFSLYGHHKPMQLVIQRS
jgi:hypothetical protein